jgi:hypothetical protein
MAVLGHTPPEGPVLFLHLEVVDEDILRAHAGTGGKPRDDGLVERFLLSSERPSFQVIWMITKSSLRGIPR